jgi:UDP-N-acetylglucosamine diphosphorylase / glucose-1-phosphate thymidylyltransferase / UDP-N-acetylgalactosamine diphosphorylase / glucosamine-1-phosphate N-acetyltransferase / galactosamine-1-phosphate N-acetyltransferase
MMQGIILAAGKGSRLQPITLNRSKAMLPILGKPIVERVMEDLSVNGVNDFILVVSPDDRYITRYFQRGSRIEADVRFVYQPERRGMADALMRAAPLISGDFLLSACDNLISCEHVQRMLKRWDETPRPNAILTLLKVLPEQVSSTGIVEQRGMWISRIVEKPKPEEAPSDISSLPLYCFSPRILDYLPEVPCSPRGEYELQDAIQMLIDRDGCVGGVIAPSRLTLTSPADLLAINQHYLTHSGDQPQLAPQAVGPGTHLVTPLLIESGTIIGKGCTVGPNAYIERDCRIGDHVVIRNAVILRQSVLPDGVTISDQVIS